MEDGAPEDLADFDAWYIAAFPRLAAALYLVGGDWGLAEDAANEACMRAVTHWHSQRKRHGGRSLRVNGPERRQLPHQLKTTRTSRRLNASMLFSYCGTFQRDSETLWCCTTCWICRRKKSHDGYGSPGRR
jgi:hypothetical protein